MYENVDMIPINISIDENLSYQCKMIEQSKLGYEFKKNELSLDITHLVLV